MPLSQSTSPRLKSPATMTVALGLLRVIELILCKDFSSSSSWYVISSVICVFFSVRKSCHFTTVFLVGRYFYLFTLSLGLWIFFFSIWAPFQYPWGRTTGSGPPTPRVQPPTPRVQPPTPAHFFYLPTPPPVFSLFFFRVPPPQIKIFFGSAPRPFSVKSPPTHTPLTTRPPVLPRVSDKTSYHTILWSLEDMRLVTCIIYHTTAEVPAPFQSDRTILNTNLAASKNLRDFTLRRLLRCFNIR